MLISAGKKAGEMMEIEDKRREDIFTIEEWEKNAEHIKFRDLGIKLQTQ